MKTEIKILIAFLLNLFFSIFELIGGIFTGSIAIVSDAIHDFGDSISIGFSYFLEIKSNKQPDEKYTYGYKRYSVLASVITTCLLLVGSCAVIFNSAVRLFNPVKINYSGMIVFAIVGFIVNLLAAYFTRNGDSLSQRAVNLHMLEDVLGWAVVLIGAIIMKFTDFAILDSLMSIGVSIFILINAFETLKIVFDLFLEKTPHGISVQEITSHLTSIPGIINVHHVHIWSLDGYSNFATMHVVTDLEPSKAKNTIRHELEEHGIYHCTLELETTTDTCNMTECHVHNHNKEHHHHNHGHHHYHGHHH